MEIGCLTLTLRDFGWWIAAVQCLGSGSDESRRSDNWLEMAESGLAAFGRATGAKPDTAAFSLRLPTDTFSRHLNFRRSIPRESGSLGGRNTCIDPRLLKNFPFFCIAERATYR